MNVIKNILYKGSCAVSIKAGLLIIILCSPWIAQSKTFYGSGVNLSDLGLGFDSELGKFRKPCVIGTIVEQGSSSSELDYSGSMSFKDKMNETFGKVSGGVNLVLFSGSVSTSLTSRKTENDQSATHGITFRYYAKDITIENRELSPLGHSMVGLPDATLSTTCGDSFVHHMKLGSEISVVTKLHFRSKEDFQKWVTKVKIRVLFVKKTKTYTKQWYELTKNAVFSVDVVADGGMTEQLSVLLNNNPRYCKTDNLQPCLETASEIFQYLFNDTGYIRDLKPTDLKVLNFSTESYQSSGHIGLLSIVNNGEKAKRFKLEDERLYLWYQKNYEDRESINAFLAVESIDENVEFYKAQLAKIEENLTSLNLASENCASTDILYECHASVDFAINNQQPIALSM